MALLSLRKSTFGRRRVRIEQGLGPLKVSSNGGYRPFIDLLLHRQGLYRSIGR